MPFPSNIKKEVHFRKPLFRTGVCRGIALRFACPLGKLQMQFMPSPSNTKKPQFPAVIFQAGVPTGIVLVAWFCFAKSAPSRHSLLSALFANAKSHRLRLSLRATFGVEPQGFSSPWNKKKEVHFRKPLFRTGVPTGIRTPVVRMKILCPNRARR